MSEVTGILSAREKGEPQPAAKLLLLVYDGASCRREDGLEKPGATARRKKMFVAGSEVSARSARSVVWEEKFAMDADTPDTEELLQRAGRGEHGACSQLLDRYRQRLRRMIVLRLDRRVAARVDPSDVVQDSLAEAAMELSDFIRRRPLPFYPWLRQIACQKLVDVHRRHLQARKRSVAREVNPLLSDQSALEIARQLCVSRMSSPSAKLRREELCQRVQNALVQLTDRDREILILRYLEQLSPQEIAAILGLSQSAVSMRHTRALCRLRDLLEDCLGGNEL
jgi:RNA polymerase sigma-70 factor (ECF subfamily)